MTTSHDPESEGSPAPAGKPPTKEQMENLYMWASRTSRALVHKYRLRTLDAEDITQDVLMSLFKGMDQLPEGFWDDATRAHAYVMKLIQYRTMAAYRHRQMLESKELSLTEAAHSAGFIEPPDIGDIQYAIQALDNEDAALIRLLVAGLSQRQIAAKLGLTPRSVHRRLSRAKEALRSSLEGGLTAKPPSSPVPEAAFPDPAPEMQSIDLYLDPGEASADEVCAVLRALNDLHIASGGLGLEFRIDGTYVLMSQGVPV